MLKVVQWAVGMPAVPMHKTYENQVHLGKGHGAPDRVTLPCLGPSGHSILLSKGSFTQVAFSASALLSCSSNMHLPRVRPMDCLHEDPPVLSGHLVRTWPAYYPYRLRLLGVSGPVLGVLAALPAGTSM